MRYQASGQYAQGVSDVDPVAAPATLLPGHFLIPHTNTDNPAALWLILDGAAGETLTLSLYYVIEDRFPSGNAATYTTATAKWFQFATGQVITVGTPLAITTGLPNGGIIYGRRTADTIGAGLTRNLLMAWV